ncbi:hypothetical protein ACFV5J_11970 [Streptomyces zaomyceticus]|uniref:hypothetical protein n=1 Tax=Streptomyces zaomyceticus TaxID=68286 RepID=UPI00364A1FC3
MIYRNFIAPPRAFSQFSHEIIRHPRLDSHAARLLTWQLSLPAHACESLSESAKRARIGATSFITAKRQLKAEGYVHERRIQVGGGRWMTQQLVSSTALRPEEAARIFGGMPVHSRTERVYPQVGPSDAGPTVGRPTHPSADGYPEKDRRENTSNLPPEPGGELGPTPETETGTGMDMGSDMGSGLGLGLASASKPAPGSEPEPRCEPVPEAEAEPNPEPWPAPERKPGDERQAHPPEPADDDDDTVADTRPGGEPDGEPEARLAARLAAQLDEARALVGALPLLSPALRHIPPGMRDELTRLAARWLAAGHTSADVHEHVLRGLPGAGTPVQRPGGLVRYLLREVPPRALPRPEPSQPSSAPRLSSRLEGARECASGAHTQPMLFRPVADEALCADCRA